VFRVFDLQTPSPGVTSNHLEAFSAASLMFMFIYILRHLVLQIIFFKVVYIDYWSKFYLLK